MRFIMRHAGGVSLVVSLLALVLSITVVANAVREKEVVMVAAPSASVHSGSVKGHAVSIKPRPYGLLLLGRNGKFPVAAIPPVGNAKNAQRLDGRNLEQIEGSCPPDTVDLGSWCMETSVYPLTNAEMGKNDYIFAAKKCVEKGGWLPTAAQLLGAANRVKLASVIGDSPLTSTIQQDPTRGLKDEREMSSTLVTTQAGSDAAGSEGVSVGSTGNPQTGEPNPLPEPAVPMPETLQYVAVYSNHQKGGFAGSEPVSQPENFRCAYDKRPGAVAESE